MAASSDVIVRLRAVGQSQFVMSMEKASSSVREVGDSSTRAGRDTEEASKKVGKASGKWRGYAKAAVGAAAGLAAFHTAKEVITGAVQGAVDLNEEVNKSAVVFRSSGAALATWSKGSAKNLAMSSAEALAAAGTFGNMLVPMGLARSKAAAMSKRMVELAADMASFNNATPEATLEAVRSGLAGETEPLRKFGVFLSQARIQAQAVSMGLVKTTKDTDKIKTAQLAAALAARKYGTALKKHGKNSEEAGRASLGLRKAEMALKASMVGKLGPLTATAKAQATYGLILKDTKDAQGDLKRTSGSLANQQKTLRAQWKNVTAELGASLIPTLSIVAEKLSWFLGNKTAVQVALGVIAAGFAAWAVAATAAAIASAASAIAAMAIPVAIAAVAASLVVLYFKWKWFHDAVNNTFAWIKAHWPLLAYVFLGPLGVLAAYAVKKFAAIKAGVRSVLGAFRTAFGGMKTAANSAIHWIADRFRDLLNLVGRVVDAIRSVPGKVASAPGKLVGKATGALGSLVPGHGQHGGTVSRAGSTWVGEAGPELLNLPKGSRITPLPLAAPALSGAMTTAHFYLDRRLVGTAVARDTADRKARR